MLGGYYHMENAISKSDTLIMLEDVSKKYDGQTVLSSVSLKIRQGESIVIRGNNGSGKSTLLKLFTGLIPLTSGGRIVNHSKLVIGYTPDRLSKLRMTSTEYLTHMGKIAKIPTNELQYRIEELHLELNLEQNKRLKMSKYSKGMLQKVNVMQAILRVPHLLVMDEPFSGLDKESIEHLLVFLKRIQSEGTSILAAVHDRLLARQLESRTYWIHEGELIEENMKETEVIVPIYYEFECHISSQAAEKLKCNFLDSIWKMEGNDLYRIRIMQKDNREFIMQLLDEGIEIISLKRQEVKH